MVWNVHIGAILLALDVHEKPNRLSAFTFTVEGIYVLNC